MFLWRNKVISRHFSYLEPLHIHVHYSNTYTYNGGFLLVAAQLSNISIKSFVYQIHNKVTQKISFHNIKWDSAIFLRDNDKRLHFQGRQFCVKH